MTGKDTLKPDENKNSDSSLSINGTPKGTERKLSHSSGNPLQDFTDKLIKNTVDMPPEFNDLINKHFWELI